MGRDAFSKCHPLTNFLYFLGAIGFTVVFQHPFYIAVSCLCGGLYLILLRGRRAWSFIGGVAPLAMIVAAVNPLFNTYGRTILFSVFGRPYTLEALCYGLVIAGILAATLLWFGCYSDILTSDKFVCLFGSLIPSISLLLVMVLRMIPNLMRKGRQLLSVRRSIGKGAGEGSGAREKLAGGMNVLSALTDWALEGSIITADSMRARGYGVAKRTSFQLYRRTGRDILLLLLSAALALVVLLSGGTEASFTPAIRIDPPTWGLAAYALYLLLPSILEGKEAIAWRISISKI